MEVLYYVSGHGYGHATRSSEILRALVAQQPDWKVHVRSNVPPHLFSGIDRVLVHSLSESLDPGVVEQSDSLGVDVSATLAAIERYYREREAMTAAEVGWIRAHRIGLVLADFPPLAGEIARACGLPSIGIGNFTWDWIYQPLADAARRPLLEWLREGYSQMTCWLRLPFSHTENADLFPAVIDMPLVARRPRQKRADVLSRLGINPNDPRPHVLLGMRGRIVVEARRLAAETAPHCVFLHFETANASACGNEIPIALSPDLLFTDVLQISDVAISKFGYGILSECIATQKPLVCPPRRQFREDEIFDREIERHLRIARISQSDFAAGRWADGINRALGQPHLTPNLATNGADVCARQIALIAARGFDISS